MHTSTGLSELKAALEKTTKLLPEHSYFRCISPWLSASCVQPA